MSHPDLELFDAHPEWRPLLAAYHEAPTSPAQPWVPRIRELGGAPTEQLSAIHGKLIALGLLKFEIANRADGVHYQVTPLGRQALIPPESRQMTPEWLVGIDSESPAAA